MLIAASARGRSLASRSNRSRGGVESGAAVWAPVIDRLATSHRVVAPDIPGLGESEPIAALDAGAFSSWLRGTMQALDMDRTRVVAHSLGGSLAARFAADASAADDE